jgi:Tfp pilus assembly protein PilN
MREAVKSAHDRADFLGVYAGNLSALDILSELSARVPADLDVVFEEVGIDPNVVRIRGYSKSFEAVERLKTELSKLDGFSQVQMSEIQTDARRGGKSFSVTLTGKPRGEG